MNEPEVLQRVHEFLLTCGLDGQPVSRLYTDAHPTLTSVARLKPFQRFAFDFGDFCVHPDLLGQVADGETLLAVEAKGSSNVLQGLFQAEMYQSGVQRSFLAAPLSTLTPSIVQLARSKEAGLIGVGRDVDLLHLPEARMPLHRLYQALVADLQSVAYVTEGGTFQYNLPTHYLVWCTALQPGVAYELEDARLALGNYPMPDNWQAAMRGAQKLGLVRIDGRTVILTDTGAAVRAVAPTTLADWAHLHTTIAVRGAKRTLSEEHPQVAATLRMLLYQDLVVRMVVEGLRGFSDQRARFIDLAQACWALDKRRSLIFFLKPESVVRLADPKGQIDWTAVVPEDLRSTTFYQYKSILQHAGVLVANRLGGATVRGYQPDRDVWQLQRVM